MLRTFSLETIAICACTASALLSHAHAREMSTDRPDGTESPISLDKGRFQVEASLFSYTRDSNNGTRLDAWSFAEMNLKRESPIRATSNSSSRRMSQNGRRPAV